MILLICTIAVCTAVFGLMISDLTDAVRELKIELSDIKRACRSISNTDSMNIRPGNPWGK